MSAISPASPSGSARTRWSPSLNSLYDRVVPIVTACGGHANKFIGDGLLAIFGAPARLDDHADRAVRAALEIGALNGRAEADGLRVGVGVNTGEVVVGTIGGGGRLDFTVIGDAVNTAARVEAATRETGDDVLITAATPRAPPRRPRRLGQARSGRPEGQERAGPALRAGLGKGRRDRPGDLLWAPVELATAKPIGVGTARSI